MRSRSDDTCQLDMYTLQSFNTPNILLILLIVSEILIWPPKTKPCLLIHEMRSRSSENCLTGMRILQGTKSGIWQLSSIRLMCSSFWFCRLMREFSSEVSIFVIWLFPCQQKPIDESWQDCKLRNINNTNFYTPDDLFYQLRFFCDVRSWNIVV